MLKPLAACNPPVTDRGDELHQPHEKTPDTVADIKVMAGSLIVEAPPPPYVIGASIVLSL